MRITYDPDVAGPNISSFISDNQKEGDDDPQNGKEATVEKTEGSYFGEWTLLDENIDSISAIAVGDVVCAVLTKETFESVVGPLRKFSQDDQMYVVIT